MTDSMEQLKAQVEALAAAHFETVRRLEALERASGVKAELGEADPGKAAGLIAAFFDEAAKRRAAALSRCVQCGADYYEAQNGEGHCSYHKGRLANYGSRYQYTCCKVEARHQGAYVEPCARGRHRGAHHTDHPYERHFDWISDSDKLVKSQWLEVERKDMVDDVSRWIRAGLLEDERFYIRAGRGEYYLGEHQQVFTREQLAAIKVEAEGGLIFDLAPEGSAWSLKAEWVADGDKVTGLLATLKAGQDSGPTVHRLDLSIDRLEKTGLEILEAPSDERPPRAGPGDYELPAAVSEGPKLDNPEPPELAKHDSVREEGASLRVELIGKVDASQGGSPFEEGEFPNYFMFGLSMVNTANRDVSIVKIACEYEAEDGAWKPCGDCVVGSRWSGRGGAEYSWSDQKMFKVEAEGMGEVAIRTEIPVHGKAGNGFALNSRAHKSLPQPLKIRVKLEDIHGKASSLIVEQANSKLRLAEREEKEKDLKAPIHFWLHCDDAEAQTRQVFYVYRAEGKDTLRQANSYRGFSEQDWDKVAFDAARQKQAEKLLDDFNSDKLKVWALVDLEKKLVYGLKCEIKTKTSREVACCFLPELPKGTASLSVKPETCTPGQSLEVSYEMPEPGDSDWVGVFKADEAGNNNYLAYVSVNPGSNDDPSKGTISGINAPDAPGQYELRYLPNNAYEPVLARVAFTVE